MDVKSFKWTKSLLNEVEEYAGLLFSENDVMKILGVSKLDFSIQTAKEFKHHYSKGKLLREARLRKSLLDAACSGSASAQEHALSLLTKLKLDTINEED